MTKGKIPAEGNFYDRYFFDKDPHRTLVDQIDAGKYIIGRARADAKETDFLWQIWTLEYIGTEQEITYASDGEPRFRWVDRLLVTDPNLPDDGSPAGIYLTNQFVDAGSPAGTTVGFLFPKAKDVGIRTYAFTIVDDPSNKFELDPNENNKLLLTDTAFGVDQEYQLEVLVVDDLGRYYQEIITIDVINLRLTNTSIVETAQLGTKIADIVAINDVPPTTFQIISDPDDKFDVSGGDLITDNVLDYSTKRQHEVTIQYTDSNSTMLSETFIIEVIPDPQGLLESVVDEDVNGDPALRVILAQDNIQHVYNEVSHIGSGDITVLTYIVPSDRRNFLKLAQCSGDNRAKYKVVINGSVEFKKRTYYTEYNADIQLKDYKLLEGDVVEVIADSLTNMPAEFNVTLSYEEEEL